MINLTDIEKEMLLEMYNKRQPPSNNLVVHQIHFKKSSRESMIAKNLRNKGLVEWVGTGLRFAVAYPTPKGMAIAKKLVR